MRNSAALAALIALALLPAGVAHADWKRDYDRGVKAAEAGNWSEAAAAMRSALAEEAEPSARKRFQGVVYKVYVPHYYAGLAAYRQGDCKAALDYWRNAASAGVVAGLAELNSVQSGGIAECATKLAGAPAAPPPATAPAMASTSTAPTTSAPTTSAPSSSAPAAPGQRLPQQSPATPPAANTDKPSISAPPAKPPIAPPAATPPASTPAPAALVQGVENYLAGRYPAVAQLDASAFGDGRARAQGFLLRAAARYTLAQLAGGDERQLEQARADVRAARAANALLDPDETLFSPRFRAFWKQTR